MGGPAWLTDTFAAVMITVAAYCAGRLVVARWWRRPTDLDADGGHVVMGVAVAGVPVAAAVPASAVPVARAVPVAGGPEESGARMTVSGPESTKAASPGDCASAGQRRPYLAPRCAAMCKIAMGITMGYTLILML